MTLHEDKVRLHHMLDHAREAVSMIEGKERSDLFQQRLLELALTRLIEIIGEAAAKVSIEAKDRYSLIPWREVVGMRNRLVHGYNSIDLSSFHHLHIIKLHLHDPAYPAQLASFFQASS